MGLAASQARLLSITSRISDNELRAQLINNQKMRLSSESSQVSENYINALNKTNLVFANYDENDNAQNVPLTFNNLTAFNQYNNQYGLTNAAGNILISETEAKKYQASLGAADPQAEFLRQHGIEYTTSYWDTLQEQLENAEIYHATPNGDGKVTDEDGAYNFYSAKQLQQMYEGVKAGDSEDYEIPPYEDTINTKEYTDFAKYADEFEMAIAEASNKEAERAALQNKFVNALLGGTTYDINALGNASTVDNIVTQITNNFNGIDETKKNEIKNTLTSNLTRTEFQKAYPSLIEHNGNYYTKDASNVDYAANSMVIDSEGTKLTIIGSTGTLIDGEDSMGVSISGDNHSSTDREFTINYDDDGTPSSTSYWFDISGSKADVYIKLDTDELNDYVNEFITDTIMDVINTQLDSGATIKTDGPVATATDPSTSEPLFTKEELETLGQGGSVAGLADVANNLATVLFGDKAGSYTDPYQLLAILNYLTAGNVQWQTSGKQDIGNDIKGNPVSFNWQDLALSQNVFNTYIIDTMMDIFGEPVYGYLYTDGSGKVNTEGNVDASAEAKWYINLFDKIQSSGYQVLANGLANSTEWLQFALENGIVVMEQVNSDDSWQGITYTSCSDISEQTDSTAATLAEAEYNKAMRQIESKDEMFDLELKNIDTEHSALEAEYESVKKAMSGNIERNFQMYS